MILPLGLVGHAFPCGRGGAGQQVFVLLIGKGGTLGFAIVVGNGQLVFQIVVDAVVVLVILPLRDIGYICGDLFGNLGFPTDKDMILPNGLNFTALGLPSRRRSTGSKSGVNLIVKGSVLSCTIIISNGARGRRRRVLIDKVKVLGAGIRLAAGDVCGGIDCAVGIAGERFLLLTLGVVAVKFPAGPVGGRCADFGRIEIFQISTVVVTGMSCFVLTGYRDRVDQFGVLIAEGLAAVENDFVDLDRDLMPGAIGGKRNGDQTQYENDGQEQSQNSFLHYFHPFKNSDLRRKARATKRFPQRVKCLLHVHTIFLFGLQVRNVSIY